MANFPRMGTRFAGEALAVGQQPTQVRLGSGKTLEDNPHPLGEADLDNSPLRLIKDRSSIQAGTSQGGAYAPRRTEKLFD